MIKEESSSTNFTVQQFPTHSFKGRDASYRSGPNKSNISQFLNLNLTCDVETFMYAITYTKITNKT